MADIQALVSDLDDTLLNVQHQITPRTEKTLKRLLKQGVKVILASGRAAASMRPIVQQVGTPYPYIAYNGAQIVDSQTGEVLIANEIPLDLSRDVLRWFDDRGIYTQFYGGDDWFYEKKGPLSDEYGRSSGVIGTETGMKLYDFISGPAPKLLAIAEPADVPALIEEARKAFGDQLIITTSKPYFIEITSPTATKGNAIRELAKRIGLTPETTICAGDSLNDLSMLTWSKMPITVSNGRDEVKEVAWRIADNSHDADGLAILLDKLIPEV